MNPAQTSRRNGAFTLVEMLCVIAIIAVLFALLMPAIAKSKDRAKRIGCIGDLREVGVGFHLFAQDHRGKFPTFVSTNDGGAEEFVAAGYRSGCKFEFSFQLFRPLSRELVTPKLLACPADVWRWPAANFDRFNNWNLSYFIGLKADPARPDAILAGDRNMCLQPCCTIRPIGPRPESDFRSRWCTGLHDRKGNLLFSDGHVEESSDSRLPGERTVVQDGMFPDTEGLPLPAGQAAPPIPDPNEPRAGYPPNRPLPTRPRAPAATPTRAVTDNHSASNNPFRPKPSTSGAVVSGARLLRERNPGGSGTPEIVLPETKTVAAAVEETNLPAAASETGDDATFASQIAPAMVESFESTRWLLWLFLLVLLLILLARVVDRKMRGRSRRVRRSGV